ncbi:MAG: DUF2878 domain-containing protein [Woeseiaceae bacterium]|nr:DUF2878 domain-containing protein [Woeseiaceae bacterium]
MTNFLLFQAAWFSSVLGAANQMPMIGPAVVAIVVAVYLVASEQPYSEFLLVLGCGFVGALFDSALVAAGWVGYPSGMFAEGVAPYWIIAMWMSFATTLKISLFWLRGKPLLAALVGLVAGPLTYLAGAKLGGIQLLDETAALVALGAGWAVILPILVNMAHPSNMSLKSNRIIIVPAVLICMSAVAWGDKSDNSYSLDFDVYLDDSKIGYHRFDITNNDNGMRQVRSEAKFDVKFLFFNAFRYRHENAELWNDGCLMKIDSETDSNGKEIVVKGAQNDSGFNVRAGDSSDELPNCVMTFAYWNPDFLKEQRLLNPQTGEYLDVEINQRSEETLSIGGRELTAVPYSIRARGIDLTVWYSPDNRWLALESLAKGGRTIRYELS